MPYITIKQSPAYHQMSLDDLLSGKYSDDYSSLISWHTSDTRTYYTEQVPFKLIKSANIPKMVAILKIFNEQTAELRERPRREQYNRFPIPKSSGGLRWINEPNGELMDALRRLKVIFEDGFGALYHTSAFAYVKHRCNVDCMKRHQANNSKWFAHYDLHDFFGSTTLEFTMRMLSDIFPFSEIVRTPEGKQELETALSLGFLDGGLPQGTPLSPTLTNIIMIPIDYALANELRNHNEQRFVYTRYADDFVVSSRYTFRFREIERLIVNTFNKFNAPFTLNVQKTRYGSSAGRNWNLGLMLNKDNTLTVGNKKKRQFQAMLSSFVMDKQNGISWNLQDVQTMEGYRNYYRMVEKDTIDGMVQHINRRFGVDAVSMIQRELQAAV